jgi:hypothetical protein
MDHPTINITATRHALLAHFDYDYDSHLQHHADNQAESESRQTLHILCDTTPDTPSFRRGRRWIKSSMMRSGGAIGNWIA